MHDLKLCDKCGWHDGHGHARECSPKMGRSADRMAKRVPNIKSTKLGYGFGKLTFKFDDRHSVTLNVHDDGKFSVDHIFWIGDMMPVDVMLLVIVLQSAVAPLPAVRKRGTA